MSELSGSLWPPIVAAPGKAGLRERAIAWLLAIFLALSPVYWLPGISASQVRLFEWAVGLSALGLVFAKELSEGRRPFPSGLLGPFGFIALLLLWIPGLLRGQTLAHSVDFVIDLGGYCAILWCFYCLTRQHSAESAIVWAVFRRAFAMLIALAGIALLNEVSGARLWGTAGKWDSNAFGGFGLRSTGWSVGLAFFMPLAALALTASSERRLLNKRTLGIVGALIIVGSQFLSGGRSGFLAGLAVVACLLFLRSSRRAAMIVVLVCVLAAGTTCLSQSCLRPLKLVPLEEILADALQDETARPVEVVCNVDRASTNRLTGLVIGLEKLAESPLYGHGHRRVLLLELGSPEMLEIHNLWLQGAVYAGIPAALLLMAMCASIVRFGQRAYRDESLSEAERNGVVILVLIVLAGLMMSLFEPSVPLGKHVSASWWAAAGALVGIAARSGSAANGGTVSAEASEA